MHIYSRTRVVALLAVLGAFAWAVIPGGSLFGGATTRLVAFEPLPTYDNGESCEWEVAAPQAPPLAPNALRLLQSPAASQLPSATGTPRPPMRYIQDAYASFSGVSVDPVHNEVVFNDENKFRVFVFDRLANTPAPDAVTTPKRVIGGLNTRTQYNSGIYIDPKDRHIYVVNNDTVHELTIYGPQANGDVAPDRMIGGTPYGSFGMTVDEAAGELFFTVQHSGAIMTFPKTAKKDDPATRMILGPSTHMADPHGIAFDSKNRVLYVANWGASRTPVIAPNAAPTDYPRTAVPGSGTFVPPSITVYPADGKGDVAPLRVIQGPKTGLNWPTGVSFDAERQELYVANAVGDTISVFAGSAVGDVAPIRVLKGPKTQLKNPAGVFVDTVNNEVWVANFGGHSATVYRRGADGDTAPLRIIRSAPATEPTPFISNPYSIAYNPNREEIIVANCVAQPRIGTFKHTADKNTAPIRAIEGSNTKMNRTQHGMQYDEVHDEIVLASQIGQAVLTFRGTANGNEAPLRVIQGPKTQLVVPEMAEIDPVNNEILVPARASVLVFNRLDQGDVAPKRVLNVRPITRVAVDYVHNFLVVSGGNRIAIYDRTAEGDAKPLRVIQGPHAPSGNARWGFDVYSPTGHILVAVPDRSNPAQSEEESQASDAAFVGIWSVFDNGDVAPAWTVGGPKGVLRQPRGVAADPKNGTIVVSDKYLNGVLTFSLPEMYASRVRETARASR
jgi:DNA-binding beta-propeller fold protein YncE